MLPGWEAGALRAALPGAAHDYVRFVEEALDVAVTLVGTWQGREAVFALR